MNITEYNKKLISIEPSYEGNTITKCCQDFLSRCLSKKIKKRMSINEAINHPWIIKIKEKVNDIVSKFESDPDKMIIELNKARLDDSFFESEKTITNATTTSEVDIDFFEPQPEKLLERKRERY